MPPIGLPKDYRIQAQNQSGATILANNIKVKFKRKKYNTNGVLIYDSEETIYDFGSSLADNIYAEGTEIDNAVAAEEWLGGDLDFEVVFPSGTDGNPVIFWLQHSTDNGLTWGDDGTGDELMSIASVASTTQTDTLSI